MATKNKPQDLETVPTFDKADLINQAPRLFGKPPEVVAGALYDIKEAITIAQATERVKAYLTRPINRQGGK